MGRRDEKKDETQAAILNTSLRLFREKGFKGTTMRDIAAEAGIALGTTYNYFPTKEHIALHFFERSLETVLARYRDEVDPALPLEEKAFLLLAIEIEQVAPYEEFLSLIVTQAAAPASRLNPFGADAARLKDLYVGFVREILAGAHAQGELPPLAGRDDILLSAFWVYHLGVLLFWLNDRSPDKEDTYVLIDRSLRFMLSALRSGGAPVVDVEGIHG